MAEEWFSIGGKFLNFSGRTLRFFTRSFSGMPLTVNLDDSSTFEVDSNVSTSLNYNGDSDFVVFEILQKNDVERIGLSDTFIFNFGQFSYPNMSRLNLEVGTKTSGLIDNAPAGLTYMFITGQNTIGGLIDNAPAGLTYMYILGQNTIGGLIDNAPAGLTYMYIVGQNTMTYTSRVWANNQERHYLRNNSFTSAMVDAYLIDLANVPSWTGSKIVDLRTSPSAPRTSASDAAVAILQSKGVTVLTY